MSAGPCFDSGRQPQTPDGSPFLSHNPKHCVGFAPRAVLIQLIRHRSCPTWPFNRDTILLLYLRIWPCVMVGGGEGAGVLKTTNTIKYWDFRIVKGSSEIFYQNDILLFYKWLIFQRHKALPTRWSFMVEIKSHTFFPGAFALTTTSSHFSRWCAILSWPTPNKLSRGNVEVKIIYCRKDRFYFFQIEHYLKYRVRLDLNFKHKIQA